MTLTHKSAYHIIVLTIYAFVCLYFFTYFPIDNIYFEKDHLRLFFPLLFASIFVFLVVNSLISYGKLAINKETPLKILLIALYACAFSIPEEIIFRGIIQTKLASLFPVSIAILLSSAIYGFAHILNGAHGYSPKEWNWSLVLVTSVLGVFLGLAYYLTGSLVLPMMLHAAYIVLNQAFIKQ